MWFLNVWLRVLTFKPSSAIRFCRFSAVMWLLHYLFVIFALNWIEISFFRLVCLQQPSWMWPLSLLHFLRSHSGIITAFLLLSTCVCVCVQYNHCFHTHAPDEDQGRFHFTSFTVTRSLFVVCLVVCMSLCWFASLHPFTPTSSTIGVCVCVCVCAPHTSVVLVQKNQHYLDYWWLIRSGLWFWASLAPPGGRYR